MKFYVMSLVGCLSLCAASATPLRAEINEKILTDVYHQGLKSFHSGQYVAASETLSQAIDGGTKDPRPFYIRGIANLRLGRQAEAKADFEKGAALEGKDFDVFFNVSTALERVQGPERRMLEGYRAAGRKSALAEIEKIRFEHFRRFDPNAGAVGAATTGTPGGAAPTGPTDPSAAPPAGTAPAGTTPAGGNPFGTPAPAGGNPFGTPTTPPAAAPPAATPPAAGGNPFGK